jgi:hypothetical protein
MRNGYLANIMDFFLYTVLDRRTIYTVFCFFCTSFSYSLYSVLLYMAVENKYIRILPFFFFALMFLLLFQKSCFIAICCVYEICSVYNSSVLFTKQTNKGKFGYIEQFEIMLQS